MEALQPELLDLPEEPYALLELLQDIVGSFKEHFTNRFKDRDDDERFSRNRLKKDLSELDYYLVEYNQQGSPASQELYTAAHWVASSLERVIHGGRIQQVLERENLQVWVTSRDVTKVPIKHQRYLIAKANFHIGLCLRF